MKQGTFDEANTLTTRYLLTVQGDESSVNRIKPLFLAWLTVLLIGLISSGPSLADDGGDGGDDGGDDAGMDDGGDGQDDGMDHDGGGHHGGDHHHGHHGHHRGHVGYYGGYGWGWGPGFYPGYGFGAFGYYPPFYGYPPRVVLQPTTPPVYIEQQNSATAPAASAQPGASYWHYCQAEGGYYPEVKECPEGWVQIAPQTQSASPEQE